MVRFFGFVFALVQVIAVILFGVSVTLPVQAIDVLPIPSTFATQGVTDHLRSAQYKYQPLPSSDGIGKIYMGREISQVMGHQGANWLERPSRSIAESPQKLIAALNLQPTDQVADIGAGTGYMSFRLAPFVPEGNVFAVDIQPEMLEMLENVQQRRGVSNIETILGTEQNPNLSENSVDLALMVDAYHEFAYPREMMEAIVKSLKPGGRAVLVEYRAENPLVLIKRHHKMSVRQVRKEMQAVGLIWQKNLKVLPEQHILIFQKEL